MECNLLRAVAAGHAAAPAAVQGQVGPVAAPAEDAEEEQQVAYWGRLS